MRGIHPFSGQKLGVEPPALRQFSLLDSDFDAEFPRGRKGVFWRSGGGPTAAHGSDKPGPGSHVVVQQEPGGRRTIDPLGQAT